MTKRLKKSENDADQYSAKASIWKYEGKAGWYFITLPVNLSNKIRKNHGMSEEGWGRLKALARVGETEWQTSIWYDTKAKAYLLPIKSTVRKSQKLKQGDKISVVITIRDEVPFFKSRRNDTER